ncbi:MAG TPA: hypothetical protein VM870_06000 [Pyrinomonadaceae bacterium]|jgi:hypothetical protein|nr:hypothetical protein [Pyrinomonadaceae bacterium]
MEEENMADKDDNICEHPVCQCVKAKGSDYCSAYCEGARDTTEIACSCGHPGCSI